MLTNKKIVLFDGVCNFCDRSVQFIIKRDADDRFRFASLQGVAGQELLKKFNLLQNEINSFVFIDGEKCFTQSTGALRVLKELGDGWQLGYAFIIVPKFIRDAVYNWIARNRYKWYGKREECLLPTAALRNKFLE